MEHMRPTVHADTAADQLAAQQMGRVTGMVTGPPTPGPGPTPATVGDEVLGNLLGMDPDSCPESLRYLAMTRGSQDSAHAVLSELEHRLAHVLGDEGPTDVLPVTPEPATAAGRYALATYDEANRLERRLRSLLGRIRGI